MDDLLLDSIISPFIINDHPISKIVIVIVAICIMLAIITIFASKDTIKLFAFQMILASSAVYLVLGIVFYWFIALTLAIYFTYCISKALQNEAIERAYYKQIGFSIEDKSEIWLIKNRRTIEELQEQAHKAELDKDLIKEYLVPTWPLILTMAIITVVFFIVGFSYDQYKLFPW